LGRAHAWQGRSLSRECGKWESAHKRFKRWVDKDVWQMVFNTLGEDADMEWVRIDSTIVRANQHAAGVKRGEGKNSPLSGVSLKKEITPLSA
jgi:hypothetical protein